MAVTGFPVTEDRAVREGAGLLDRSERGKLALSGAGAAEFLNGQVTNDILALRAGDGCYAAFLTHKGKMLGDLRVLATEDAELWLDTERVALQGLFDMIRRFSIGYDVELHKRTLQQGLLSLIGPRARALAAAEDLPDREHANAGSELEGHPVVLVSTAEGVDLVCDAERTAALADILVRRGARRVSEQAAEVLRVERGRPRYGLDMDDTTIPQEAGINPRAVSFSKGCYVGQETVARLHYRGRPNRHLRGLLLSRPMPSGSELRLNDRPVGTLSSVVVSPRLGPIGLAIVRREAEPGDSLTVLPGTAERSTGPERSGPAEPACARVVALPFEV